MSEKIKNILDYGCGLGGNSVFLSKRGKYFGIDILKENIDYAQNRYGAKKFALFDGNEIPFENSFFDEVHSYDVFEHVVDLDKSLKDVCRVLKKDGKIFITVPAKISEQKLSKIKPNYFLEVGHLRVVDLEKLKEKMEVNNCKFIKSSKTRGMEAVVLLLVFWWRKNKQTVVFQTGSPKFNKFLVAFIWIFDTRLFRTNLKYLFFIYIFTLPIGWVISNFFPKTIYLEFRKIL